MKKPLTLLLVGGIVLAGCGDWPDSGFNPRNWFGKSRSVAVEPRESDPANPLLPKKRGNVFSKRETEDLSTPIARITQLRVAPTTTGAIVYAEGLASRLGAYDVELRPVTSPEEAASGVLVLSFRVVYPEQPTAAGTEHSRTVHAAYTVAKQELSAIRTVRVVGAENLQETRRR